MDQKLWICERPVSDQWQFPEEGLANRIPMLRLAAVFIRGFFAMLAG